MSNSITKIVEHIKNDICEDCKTKCELCEHGVCEDVIIEIGAFFLYYANKEKEKE